MSRAGPLKQILRQLNIKELRELRKEFCPRVTEYSGNKTEFVDSLRNSMKRSIEDGELSYAEIFSKIRSTIKEDGPKQVTTRIRHSMENLEISRNVQSRKTTSVREKWISSELFQSLKYQLEDTNYEIEQEATFGRTAADLLVHQNNRNYVIETKLASSYSSRERLLNQVKKYKKKVPNLRRVFVLLIAENERDLPENKDSVKHVVDEVEKEDKTEVILKKPSDFRD
ncbi:MAG: hypothetical protein ABEK16_06595 [Candidatus Nanohalobium sp.]